MFEKATGKTTLCDGRSIVLIPRRQKTPRQSVELINGLDAVAEEAVHNAVAVNRINQYEMNLLHWTLPHDPCVSSCSQHIHKYVLIALIIP